MIQKINHTNHQVSQKISWRNSKPRTTAFFAVAVMAMLASSTVINVQPAEALSLRGSTDEYVSEFVDETYKITFDQDRSALKNNPTVCAIKPSSGNLEKWAIDRLMKQSKISSDEWENKLKQNQKNPDIWNVTYVEKSETDDTLDCNIIITFLPKVEDKKFEHNLLGVTDYDPINDAYMITIYYLLDKLCYKSEKIDGILWYWHEPCFINDVRISQDLNITISHELGHTFGLGHYTTDKKLNLQLIKGYAPSPSIMTKYAIGNLDNQQIRDGDIKKIREIYGDKGFQAFLGDESFDAFR